ncbi:MAG: cold shock domain-containing protein [Bacteroidetes bacterium]|nr:cold shock domain-containing protein [Bacteroidota bacterium]
MAKPISFNKRDLEKKRQLKRAEKQKKKESRKANSTGGSFDSMIAYVDEFGVITDTPPDPTKKQEVDIENIDISTRPKEHEDEVVLKGQVEHFNESKGYGFIKCLNNNYKYFFHISSAPDNITEGNLVTFELEKGQRGMNAVRVSITK